MDAGLAAHQGVQLYNIQGGCSGTSTQKEKKTKHESYQQSNQILEQPSKKKLKKKTKHRSHRPQVVWRSREYKVENKKKKEFSVFRVPKLPSS